MNPTQNESSRKTYSLDFKLKVAKAVIPNSKGHGYLAVAKKYAVPHTNVKTWYKNKHLLIEATNNNNLCVRKSRNLPGCGRKSYFANLEDQLENWIVEYNNNGLVIKDKYIRAKALKLKESALEEQFDDVLFAFTASNGNLKILLC